jgi:recombinational DNA repair protein RecT
VLGTSIQFVLQKWGLIHLARFNANARKLNATPVCYEEVVNGPTQQ